MSVTGNYKEHGQLKEFKHDLKWYEGDFWKSETPFQIYADTFSYKYVMVGQDDEKTWEDGQDRAAKFTGFTLELKDRWNSPFPDDKN